MSQKAKISKEEESESVMSMSASPIHSPISSENEDDFCEYLPSLRKTLKIENEEKGGSTINKEEKKKRKSDSEKVEPENKKKSQQGSKKKKEAEEGKIKPLTLVRNSGEEKGEEWANKSDKDQETTIPKVDSGAQFRIFCCQKLFSTPVLFCEHCSYYSAVRERIIEAKIRKVCKNSECQDEKMKMKEYIKNLEKANSEWRIKIEKAQELAKLFK